MLAHYNPADTPDDILRGLLIALLLVAAVLVVRVWRGR